MTSRLRIAFWFVVLAVVALGVGQIVLPPTVERRIEQAVHRSFDDVGLARAEVAAFPAFRLLAGQLSSLTIDVRRFGLGDLMVDALLIDGRNVQVDVPRLIRGDGVVVRSADHLAATLVVAEDDLNHYFWEILNQSQLLKVTLKRGSATLTGRVRILGRQLDVEVSGHFRIRDDTSVAFVPREVNVERARVPQVFLDMIAEEWIIPLALDQNAIPLVITDLLVEDGKLLIYGTYPTEV